MRHDIALRRLRSRLGLHQHELARIVGVSPQFICQLELGRKSSRPVWEVLARRFCADLEALGYEPHLILDRLPRPGRKRR